ncbi:hypothetical protein [Pseudoxanthomonas suwonensis]|uniref:hypothetical protein n=1 Tax=Pseudoxanthomonas suwonensis TaxID=314722 RepID=UPI001FEC0520|nr:hypothetical protein [Pseudoxanthomonas suwonensis]
MRLETMLVLTLWATPAATQEAVAPGHAAYAVQVQDFATAAVPRIADDAADGLGPLLAEVLSGAPDFAGDQVLVQWGCGTDCLRLLAADRGSGRLVPLPGAACCWNGAGEMLDYRPDSRLLVVGGKLEGFPGHGRHYFVFEGGRFVRVHFEPVAETGPLAD